MNLTELSDEPPRLLPLWPEFQLMRRMAVLGSFVMLAMMTQFLVNAADNLMVGRLPAEEATASQAALGLGMPLYWAVGGFFAAVSFGTQAMTARRYAEGQDGLAGQVLLNSLAVSIVAGLIGTAIGYYASPAAIGFFADASFEQQTLGTSYSQLRALGIVSMVVTFSYKAFFDGIGRTYVHLLAAVAMNLSNICLNYVFIYGDPDFHIPQMGLDGAGLASTISTYFGLLIMFVVSMRGRYRRKFKYYRLSHLSKKVMERIVRLLLPSGSATVILMAGFLLFMKFVGQIDASSGAGNVNSAATKALMDTAAICFMPLLAFGTATATAVSQSLGSGKSNLAARYGWTSVRMGLWAMAIIGLIFWIYPEEILSLWAPNDPRVVEVGVAPLRLIVTSLPMMVFGLVLSQALYGAGANTYVMIAEGLLHFGVLVPLSWLLGPYLGYGMIGIWTAAIVYVNGLGLAMAAKFLLPGWRSLRL